MNLLDRTYFCWWHGLATLDDIGCLYSSLYNKLFFTLYSQIDKWKETPHVWSRGKNENKKKILKFKLKEK